MLKPLHRLFSRLWLIPVMVLGVFVLLLVAVNLFLQSSEVQKRIRIATAASIGLPVEIGGASYTPWSGLTLSRLEVADPGRPSENVFTARKLNARMALWLLLQRKVVITAVRLVDPVLVVPEDSEGVFLPPPRGEVVVVEPPGVVPERAVPSIPEVAAVEGTGAVEPVEEIPVSAPSYTVEVHSFVIENGGILICDPLGRPGVQFEKIQLKMRIASNSEQSGEVSIGKIGFERSLYLKDFTARFTRAEGRVELPVFEGKLAGGKLAGKFGFDEEASEVDLKAALEGVAVARMFEEAGLDAGRAGGFLQGEVVLKGPLATPGELSGMGKFELIEGQLEPLDFIQQLGQLLRIDELQLLQLREALLDVALADGLVTVNKLSLLSENVWFRGEGRVDLDGGLDLRGRLLINDRMHRNLGGLLGSPFRPSEEAGYRELGFDIGGTLQQPRTNLLDQFAGGKIGSEVGRFLQNLLKPAPSPKSKD